MEGKVVIKPSLVSMGLKILVAAVGFDPLYFLVGVFGDVLQNAEGWGVLRFIRFDLWLSVLIILTQISLIVAFIVDWYRETYEVDRETGEVVHKAGLIRRRERKIGLKGVDRVILHQGGLEKMLRMGTIELHKTRGESEFLPWVEDPEEAMWWLERVREKS